MDEKDTKVTIFYDASGEVYAFSENKKLVALFEGTRKLNGYIKRKVTMNEYQYRTFLSFYRNKLLIMNVLTDGEKSYDFVTTQEEDLALTNECDKSYDRMMELERTLLQIPFDRKMRTYLGDLVAIRKSKEGKYGKYNTFEIFIKLFKDSIL